MEISRVTRSKEEARSSYDRLSRWYDLMAAGSERKHREEGLRRLEVREGETVLEIGCGTGHALVALARSVGTTGSVNALDLSPGMLAVARSRLERAGLAERVVLHCGDAAALPFPGDFFDAVFMGFTLELFDTPEIPVVLEECRRVLGPRGRIGAVALSREGGDRLALRLYEWAHQRFPGYVDCRPIFARRALAEAGFRILDADEMSMWGLPVEIVVAGRP